MRFGLMESTIDAICGVLAHHPAVEKAVLYGSRAKGNFKPGSDIDLTLFGAALDARQLAMIDEELDDLLLPYQIDLSIFAQLDHAKLREHIERVGVEFYRRENGASETRKLGGVRKDSGVVVKEGWRRQKLQDVCELVNGRAYSKPELLSEGKYRVLRVGNFFTNNHWYYSDLELEEKKYCDNGDLLYAWSASFGPRVWSGEKVIFHYHIWKVIPDRMLVEQKFLFYFFVWDTEQIKEDQGTGTTMIHVSKGSMEDRDIFVPPIPEQHRIIAILDEAFDGIATAKASAEKNLQNARALFESHLQAVFSQRGEGWSEKRLGDSSILKIIDGDRGSNYPSKEDFSDEGFCLFLNTKNVRPDGFNFDTTMFIAEEKDNVLRKGKLQRQDVILTTRGTIGNVALFDEGVEFENIRINSGMLIFRPNLEKIMPSFLFEVFRSGIMKSQMIRHVSGAAQPQLPIKTLIDFEIPVPSTLESQREIVASVRGIEEETQRLEAIYQQKLAALDELKKSLLHQAFSGQL
ncbi:MAG: restriction endonuclease subunit S [Methylococcaceae bacterium]|nr:restriction endonuclease subunit S [Methylococcaceae bacterium]MDZ4156959.1 restriction endonuclease subunit S [Methylococcales bacterium]MDP2393993.1 restriction endonuclease subunit S [Methylococcaceae bacterium]MDP3018543.1 restriction endonuclease subunit S [Methylococcaceae bacterium]MDP3391298.1 restriction endonuclease subunit S [Methylococcaceae bacterium]